MSAALDRLAARAVAWLALAAVLGTVLTVVNVDLLLSGAPRTGLRIGLGAVLLGTGALLLASRGARDLLAPRLTGRLQQRGGRLRRTGRRLADWLLVGAGVVWAADGVFQLVRVLAAAL